MIVIYIALGIVLAHLIITGTLWKAVGALFGAFLGLAAFGLVISGVIAVCFRLGVWVGSPGGTAVISGAAVLLFAVGGPLVLIAFSYAGWQGIRDWRAKRKRWRVEAQAEIAKLAAEAAALRREA